MTRARIFRRLRRWHVVPVAFGLAVLSFAPSWLAAPKASSSVPPTPAAGRPSKPAVPPAGAAYLGAFLDPSGQGLSADQPMGGASGVTAELASLPKFNEGLGRPLSILEVDQAWDSPITLSQLDGVLAAGAIPMINWHCGDSNANIVAGADDAAISGFAQELATFRAPLLLRWFPDPNAADATTASCLGTTGPAGYIAAFRHVHDLLLTAGATNVANVWSSDATTGTAADWGAFYPGADVVDWVAADAFVPSAASDAGILTSVYGPWYQAFAPYGKPLLISNSGAVGDAASPRSSSRRSATFPRCSRRSKVSSTAMRPT